MSIFLKRNVSFHYSCNVENLALIDLDDNGGVFGEDARVIFLTKLTVDIKGIDDHHVNYIGIGTDGGVVNTQWGLVIAIMHQYFLIGKGASIHPESIGMVEHYVNDKSVHVPGGIQRLTTLDGYVIPLSV
jgi:hypothetical protein